jgi:hypothetical protein
MEAGELASLCSDWAGVMAPRLGTMRGGEDVVRRGRFEDVE